MTVEVRVGVEVRIWVKVRVKAGVRAEVSIRISTVISGQLRVNRCPTASSCVYQGHIKS